MKNLKKKIIPLLIVAAIVFGYYSFRAPHFAKETSVFNYWVKQTLQEFSIEKKKNGEASFPQISISALNPASTKPLHFSLESAAEVDQTIRLLNLANESGLEFKETSSNTPLDTEPGSWLITVKRPKSDQAFYAKISENKLQTNPAGLNLLQLMRMWSK